jgi:hypothetical protein
MIAFNDAATLIQQQRTVSGTVEQCAEALVDGRARPMTDAPGHDTAGRLLAIFQIREASARQAGRAALGIEGVLRMLAEQPDDDEVLVFHFGGAQTTFSVFVHDASRRVLGCIMLPRGSPHPS